MNITALSYTSLHASIDCGHRADQVIRLCLRQYANLLAVIKMLTLEWLQAMQHQGMPISVLSVSWDESVS